MLNSSQTYPDRDSTQSDVTGIVPELVPEYQKCKAQIGTKFGCVPLAPIYVYKGQPKVWESVPDIFMAHKLIRDSGLPNFLGLRIPVETNLNVSSWRKHLVDYFDQQLPDLIEFGFPLDFDRTRDLQSTLVNHASARLNPDHVDKYIQEEVGFKAMLGPLDIKPFDIHISPFMTRDKSDSNSRRTIMDLSFPKGLSVNDGVLNNMYLGTKFSMHYPSVDSIIRTLNEIGPSAHIFKVDISRAFRHIRIDPGDIDLLGLQHRGKLYLDLFLPFGFRLGAFFFSKLSDSIRYIMNINGHDALFSYIDDLIYCGLPSTIHTSYQFLLDLLQELGLDISYKKLCPPSTKVVCLGILIDTIQRTISIPEDKLKQICTVCNAWSDKRMVSRSELQSLLGLLLYITKCVKPARFFLNRMLQLLRDNSDQTSIILTPEFFKDLTWFQVFLTSYNGVSFYHQPPVSKSIYLDACLEGLGGAFDNYVYALPIAKGFRGYNIAHLEILNLVVALKIWGQVWANKSIEIHCDNLAVVEILSLGKARDSIMATCARNIWLLAAIYNINLIVTHIRGTENCVADLLSRWFQTRDNCDKLRQFLDSPIWMNVHIDLTLLNHDI